MTDEVERPRGELREAQTVMGFLPMPDELDTLPILADLLAQRAAPSVGTPPVFLRTLMLTSLAGTATAIRCRTASGFYLSIARVISG